MKAANTIGVRRPEKKLSPPPSTKLLKELKAIYIDKSKPDKEVACYLYARAAKRGN